MKTTQMSMTLMTEQSMIQIYNEMLLINKMNEWTTDTYNNRDEYQVD